MSMVTLPLFRSVKVHVISLTETSKKSALDQLNDIITNKSYCLDIDMDFYSTCNPFKSLLGDTFLQIHELFKFQEFAELPETIRYRRDQLNCLRLLVNEGAALEDLPESAFSRHLQDNFSNVSDIIAKAKAKVAQDEYISDLLVIGEETELPENISSVSDICSSIKITGDLLRNLDCEPLSITIARSEYDEYSDGATINYTQHALLKELKDVYKLPDKLVRFHYS